MARFEITDELVNTLRSVRVSNGILSKDVAAHIEKSPSYYTRLEKGEIKTIDEKELISILRFVYKIQDANEESFRDILERIYDSLAIKYTDDEISKQLWFDNYDTVSREIPIPEDMVDDINLRIREAKISVAYLCERINANEGISPKVTNRDDYPFNQWQALVTDHKIEFYFIKMKVDELEVNKILNKEISVINYVTMLAIVYYLLKIELYGFQIDISEDENQSINRSARDYLNKYKFYSIAERSKLLRAIKGKEELNEVLSSFDLENTKLVSKVAMYYKAASDYNMKSFNSLLQKYLNNLEWDSGFMYTIGSLPFNTLKELSYTQKSSLLGEIKSLIEQYKEKADKTSSINEYFVE